MPCCRSCRCRAAYRSAPSRSVSLAPRMRRFSQRRSSRGTAPRCASGCGPGALREPMRSWGSATRVPPRNRDAVKSTPRADGSIAPGSAIGILGGGQLGRMTALAARSMGFRIHVLDPDAECSAAPVADRVIAARFDDVEAAHELARHSDVVTLEIEQISTEALDAANTHAPVRPGASVIGTVQDRARQKHWLRDNGYPVGEFAAVDTAADVAAAVSRFGDTFVKSCHGGYDGRSQVRVRTAS